jgi:hypothetical protein
LHCVDGDAVRINPSFDNSRNFHYLSSPPEKDLRTHPTRDRAKR